MVKKGRPTRYKPAYCQLLIEHAKRGLSFDAFAADCDVNIDTLYAWSGKHPLFSEAKKKAEAISQKVLESIGVSIAAGKSKGSGTGAWIFLMKNRLKWSDRVEVNGNTNSDFTLKYALDILPESLSPRKSVIKNDDSGGENQNG